MLDAIINVVKPAKTEAMPPKRLVPTVDDISLLASTYVRIVEEERVAVVGLPIGTEEYV